MHSYSIDTNERKNGVFIISLISIGVSYLIFWLLAFTNFSIPSFIDGPSVFVIFGIFYWVFDNYAWKWKVFRFIRIINTPNLNGTWKGEYISSYRDNDTGEKIIGETELKIEQSWTKIRIISKNGTSTSCSEVAGLTINDNMGIVLRFQYKNEAKFDTVDTMNSHWGFNKLTYYSGGQLEGDYFNDKNRKTYGTLKYEKVG